MYSTVPVYYTDQEIIFLLGFFICYLYWRYCTSCKCKHAKWKEFLMYNIPLTLRNVHFPHIIRNMWMPLKLHQMPITLYSISPRLLIEIGSMYREKVQIMEELFYLWKGRYHLGMSFPLNIHSSPSPLFMFIFLS